VLAVTNLGNSVDAEVNGLEPGRTYWYSFIAGGEASPIGRTRTATAGDVDAVRIAFVSCQHWEQGLYTVYEHILHEDVDLVVHLGDYIYENAPGANVVRSHDSPEIITLDDYRRRYALYKTDPALRAVHEAFPFVVSRDDHEVDNNYAGVHPAENAPPVDFLARRAAAYQAYYEFMPLRRRSLPQNGEQRIYRALDFGSLLRFQVLDGRQYRTDQPCGDGYQSDCAGAADPSATMLGAAQERWLIDELAHTRARWNVLANQVPFAPSARIREGTRQFDVDKWTGYLSQRGRVTEALAARRDANPVIITGDVHVSWVADVKRDYDDESAPAVATEFVGTSITSGGDGRAGGADNPLLRANPHMRFFDARRGYVRCAVSRDTFSADYRLVDYVSRPGAPVQTAARFIVENGRPGAQRDG